MVVTVAFTAGRGRRIPRCLMADQRFESACFSQAPVAAADSLICLSFWPVKTAYKSALRQSGAAMKYATVMVGMSLGQSNEARLEIAAQLAERFGAGVIGVAAAEFTPPLYFTDGAPAQRLIGGQEQGRGT